MLIHDNKKRSLEKRDFWDGMYPQELYPDSPRWKYIYFYLKIFEKLSNKM
jgi:hypothetical protein